jgi:hypothetical protein
MSLFITMQSPLEQGQKEADGISATSAMSLKLAVSTSSWLRSGEC